MICGASLCGPRTRSLYIYHSYYHSYYLWRHAVRAKIEDFKSYRVVQLTMASEIGNKMTVVCKACTYFQIIIPTCGCWEIHRSSRCSVANQLNYIRSFVTCPRRETAHTYLLCTMLYTYLLCTAELNVIFLWGRLPLYYLYITSIPTYFDLWV